MNIIFKPECKTEIIEPTYDLPIIGEPISKTGASANNSNAYGVIVGIIGDGSSRRVRVMTEGYIDYDKVKDNYMEYTDEAINALTGITLCSGGKLPNSNIRNGTGLFSIEEGFNTKASGKNSHAEGSRTTASGICSHAEGKNTTASGSGSHAEGTMTKASGDFSHAEGAATAASGNFSHAECSATTASGSDSHAEGNHTTASGDFSHAEGSGTTASGSCSHAEGYYTKASGNNSHVEGKYNIEDTANKYAHIIGNGTATTNLHNCFMVGWDGEIYVQASDDATKMMKLTIKSDGTISAEQVTV